MAFEIKVIDDFITECKASGKEISYENFSPINESLNSDIQIPVEIFEAYLKYADVTGTEMVTLMEFEKIKSFSEFVNDKKSGSESVSDDDDDDDDDDEVEGEEAPAEEPTAEEKPEGEEEEEDKDGEPGMDIKVETASVGMETDEEKKKVEEAAKAIETHPEKVAAQASAKKDDESQQTKVDLETGDGSKTAGKIEDTINKLGEPEKKSEKEGEKLVGEAEAKLDVQPEDVKSTKGEKDNKEAGVQVDAETGDGSKTAGKIEDTINKLGEPEKKSEKEGEKLLGESEGGEKKTLN